MNILKQMIGPSMSCTDVHLIEALNNESTANKKQDCLSKKLDNLNLDDLLKNQCNKRDIEQLADEMVKKQMEIVNRAETRDNIREEDFKDTDDNGADIVIDSVIDYAEDEDEDKDQNKHMENELSKLIGDSDSDEDEDHGDDDKFDDNRFEEENANDNSSLFAKTSAQNTNAGNVDDEDEMKRKRKVRIVGVEKKLGTGKTVVVGKQAVTADNHHTNSKSEPLNEDEKKARKLLEDYEQKQSERMASIEAIIAKQQKLHEKLLNEDMKAVVGPALFAFVGVVTLDWLNESDDALYAPDTLLTAIKTTQNVDKLPTDDNFFECTDESCLAHMSSKRVVTDCKTIVKHMMNALTHMSEGVNDKEAFRALLDITDSAVEWTIDYETDKTMTEEDRTSGQLCAIMHRKVRKADTKLFVLKRRTDTNDQIDKSMRVSKDTSSLCRAMFVLKNLQALIKQRLAKRVPQLKRGHKLKENESSNFEVAQAVINDETKGQNVVGFVLTKLLEAMQEAARSAYKYTLATAASVTFARTEVANIRSKALHNRPRISSAKSLMNVDVPEWEDYDSDEDASDSHNMLNKLNIQNLEDNSSSSEESEEDSF